MAHLALPIKNKNSISFRLLLLIILCSSLLTLVTTFIQLYFEYRKDINLIQNNIEFIKNSYLPAISASVYDLDEEQIRTQLQGALKLQGIEFLDVREKYLEAELAVSVGNTDSAVDIVKEFKLTFTDSYNITSSVGTLTVKASFAEIYHRLIERCLVVLITNAIKTFLAAFCILLIIQYTVTKHLSTMAKYTQQLDLDKLDRKLVLNRSASKTSKPDELEHVVKSINDMQERMRLDIMHREKVEEMLRESEERFRAIFDQAAVGVAQIETMTGRFIRINQRYCDIVGYPQKELTATTFMKINHPDDLQAYLDNMEKLNAGEIRKFTMERRYFCKGKSIVWVNLTVSPMWNMDEEPSFHIEVVEDITERKQAEEELLKHRKHLEVLVKARTADLEKAYKELKETQSRLVQSAKLASIGELATGVAHELNQPLMYIRSNAQLETAEGLENLNPQSAYETLKLVEEGTDRMMNIINHLRNFARQTEFSFEPVQLNNVLEESFVMFNEQFRLRSISIEKDYDEQLPTILGNVNKLEQVFINILSNARDVLLNREGAILKIETRFQQTGDGNGDVIVCFVDNGGGIPQSMLDKIFDPFFSTKEVGEGTGLGLSISYGIVKDHKGDISVSSVEGEGTTFEISFPVLHET